MTAPPRPSAPSPSPPSAPGRLTRSVWLVALSALVASVVSLVIAAGSFAHAVTARDRAAAAERLADAMSNGDPVEPRPAPADPTPTGQNLPEDTPVSPPADPPVETPPQSFDPQAEFTLRYSDEVLNPQVTSANVYIDLDEPRVVFDREEADLVLEVNSFGSDPPYFDLPTSTVAAAEAGDAEANPDDCLERLRTSPLPPSVQVPAQRGTVLCLLTSLVRAAEQGINQKIVVVYVSALGAEGRVTLELNAWEQPR